MKMKNSKHKINSKISNLLLILLGVFFFMSAAAKFYGDVGMVSNFRKWGLINQIWLIGGIEIIAIIIFLIPRTFMLGLLLLSSYMGGAIVIHLANGNNIFPPLIILAIIWATAWLNRPQVFYRI